MKTLILFIAISCTVYSQSLAPVQNIFMQGNNINAVFRTDGYFNYDKITFANGDAGFIWPVTSPQRMTAIFATGIWIGAKAGPQRELRLAASTYNTHYSPGNIPVIGQIPPSSVCTDPSWRGYYVHLNDPSLFNGGTRYKMAGGSQYTFNYDSWASWPVEKGAPYVEVNGIPGYQPAWDGDRPGIGNGMTARPEEILFMVYMDYTNCTDSIHTSEAGLPGGSKPLGVEIQQIVFNFNCFPLSDMYFVKYIIINKSSLVWDSTFAGICSDSDLGDAADDASGCDTTRNLGFMYNHDNNDYSYGTNPPAVGIRLLQSPLRFTGSNTDTAKLPYDTLTGYKHIGMTTHNSFKNSGCYGDPDKDTSAYYYLTGLNECGQPMINWITGQPSKFRFSGNACQRTGWYDSLPGDKKNFIGSGPFVMNSGDTQIVMSSFMITRDGGNNFQNVCALQSLSDSALKYYYNDFRTCTPIGIEPISTEIPQKFELLQNYPNPFNPVTKIKFSIPLSRGVDGVAGRGVLLKIYDVLGKEIAVLVNEQLKPGIYEINWNSENLPSGVYFYTLITNEFTQTKKMVVVK
ncbi:MAG TPA: T9SS type A sorting domain-containing protein [Ignavibacteria bacterium]|nr:T9SS type A sorting domain-containing protein [Ignavibacteria bacterium]HRJ04269.1 T9SS type A sorting domain-containing protein [Ignavibacteria bacterium]